MAHPREAGASLLWVRVSGEECLLVGLGIIGRLPVYGFLSEFAEIYKASKVTRVDASDGYHI